QGGDDLAALVLHLEPALPVTLVGGDVGGARIARTGGHGDAEGRDESGLGREARQRFHHLFRRRLEGVGAQVERGPAGHALPFLNPIGAEGTLQRGRQPFRNIGADGGRRGCEIGGGGGDLRL